MSPSETREEGLARLARELLSPEWPSADLLVRYVDDPDSLTPEERRAFVAGLESSPELRAQVRLLQTANIAELRARAAADPDADADAEADETDRRDARPGRGAPRRRAPRRRGRWSLIPAALAGAAAAAAVLLFLAPRGLFEPETTPVRSARPEEAPADEEAVPGPAVRVPVTPDARVRYRAPAGASPRPRLESVVHLGRGRDGEGREMRGVAVVPEHVGRTRLAAPTVFWHLSGFVPEAGEFLLRIARADAGDPLIEMALRGWPGVGLQETSFASLGIDLPVAMTYRWSVLYVASAASPPRPVAEGWIQRYPAPAAPSAATGEASPLSRVRDAAGAGFWYDAFAAAHPAGGVLEQAERGLLVDVGLERLLDPGN